MVIYISKKANIKICIPVSMEAVKLATLYFIVALSILAVASGTVCAVLNSQIERVTVEAGERISAEEIAGDEGAYFGQDFDPDYLNHAGVYRFLIVSNGEALRVRLKVKDTKAPEVTVKDIYFAIGGEIPKPEDFIESIYEPDDFSGKFISDLPKFKAPGEYSAKIRFTDASGNKTEIFDVKMTLIYDSVAPKIEVESDIYVYVGESVAYRSVISVSDNCIGDIELVVDDSRVDINEAGDYSAKINAIDAMGNKSAEATVKVHVTSKEDIKDELFGKIADIAKGIIDEGMTPEQKCRAVYAYIQDKIDYAPSTYKGDRYLAAYNALFVTGEGDCYSYFAAAKAFFDYLGIENRDMQRAAGYTADTHYWNLVNIGENGEDRWYHFDATVMREEYKINSCLLTDAQVEAYSKMRPYFYKHDKRNLLSSSADIITENPILDSYIEK